MIYQFYSDDYDFDRLSKEEILEYKKYLYKCLKEKVYCKEYIMNKIYILNKYILKKKKDNKEVKNV